MLGRSVKLFLVAIAALVGLSACGGASGPSASVVPRAAATPTVDPSVAEVEAAAKRFIEAEVKSEETGDASPLDVLVVPGSHAYGNAGADASAVHQINSAFVARNVAYGLPWTINVTGTGATVTVQATAFGHHATFPGLVATDSDHAEPTRLVHLTLEKIGGQWLISEIG